MKLLFLHCLVFLAAFSASAQNLNTTFRSKITYPGQTLANVWGYTAGGYEYALAGGALGLIIIDITNPDTPQQIVQIPGPNNMWKEIKTFSHYAYVVSEGGMGIQVVDLSGLPSPNLNYHHYKGDGAILNQLNKIHALHIDTAKGFLYAYGGGLFSGGVKIFDLNPDPYNPVYVGKYDQLGYVHDGYVDNDTLYAGHIYAGMYSVVNLADKNAPELISTQNTPGNFTHNTWLSDDRRIIFSTDEVNNSFLTAYDVSDPTDIQLLDKIQSNPGSNSMVHNTHILGNYAVTSWYKDGFTIVDLSRPDNLVQVGNYDTYTGSGGGSDGCWGVYPFFPSGTIIASNITAQGTPNGELWIITPNYVRACYLEGQITNGATGAPLNGVKIEILGSTPPTVEFSNQAGVYKAGQEKAGLFTVRVSKTGFQNVETQVLLENGKVRVLDVELYPTGSLTISGQVLRTPDLTPVEGASVYLYGLELVYSALTDGDGYFSISGVSPGPYDVTASALDVGQVMRHQQKLVTDSTLLLEIYKEYRRDKEKWTSDDPLNVRENPFRGYATLDYNLPETDGYSIAVVNVSGQIIESNELQDGFGSINIGSAWSPGVYFVHLERGARIVQTIKLVKL